MESNIRFIVLHWSPINRLLDSLFLTLDDNTSKKRKFQTEVDSYARKNKQCLFNRCTFVCMEVIGSSNK